MKNVFALPIFLALSCAPLSSGAWWSPYGAAPYWGGYAPYYYAPPQYPVYAPPPWAGGYQYSPMWGGGQPVAPYAQPWGPTDDFDDGMMPPDAQSTESATDQKQKAKEFEDRRAAFRARMEERRATMKARRDAWRQYMDKYSAENPAPESLPAQEAQVAPVPGMERKPAPMVVPDAEAMPKAAQ